MHLRGNASDGMREKVISKFPKGKGYIIRVYIKKKDLQILLCVFRASN